MIVNGLPCHAFIMTAFISVGLTVPAASAEQSNVWQCELHTAQKSSQTAFDRTIIADVNRRVVHDQPVDYRDGVSSKTLPDLTYDVTVFREAMIWGAHNSRTGATYFLYELNFATGKVSLHTGEIAEIVGACTKPIA